LAKNRIEFWFKDRHNTYLQLPVNPSEIDYSSPYGMNTIEIARLGDVAIPGERGLKQVLFSSFFPRDYNSSYCEYEGFMEPWKWVDQFEEWRDDRRNIRLIIAGTPISIPVFVQDFELQPERAGNPGDIFYSVTLTEYKPVLARQVVSDEPTKVVATTTRPASAKQRPKTHTVRFYDTLYSLAKEYYGDIAEWRRIYDANRMLIGKDTTVLKVGTVLTIP